MSFSSCEVLNPQVNSWRPISGMSTRRSSVGLCVLNGLLYAVGGYDGALRRCLSSVEAYNPCTDEWSPVPEMTFR
ncbi:unnamed protein product [Protopolystoma xenopodis]|uniref:BACK domain-containing protein n=1 Tax=Protopolystoma xenopodis TaxID=117903 RepID=A0A448WPH9_9PLAT|nr:unnamed protein product [Protopolystoma xenopodis]